MIKTQRTLPGPPPIMTHRQPFPPSHARRFDWPGLHPVRHHWGFLHRLCFHVRSQHFFIANQLQALRQAPNTHKAAVGG